MLKPFTIEDRRSLVLLVFMVDSYFVVQSVGGTDPMIARERLLTLMALIYSTAVTKSSYKSSLGMRHTTISQILEGMLHEAN